MHTLLMCLAGPMQSWGIQSHFPNRDTGLEPSKSGVIGLLCAAMGKPREENRLGDGYPSLATLAALFMGVRVDWQGTLQYDYQAAQNVRVSNATDKEVAQVLTGRRKDEKGNILRDSVSNRHYLSDAAFLVGLEGDDVDLLRTLHVALREPVWALYLGRKAFVPGDPVWLEDGLQEDVPLVDALGHYPWQGSDLRQPPDLLRLVLEDESGAEVRPDQPLSFAGRRFAPRRVRTMFVNFTDLYPPTGGGPCTSPA